ncbi:MAG TPA: phage major capsid protein [Syntrophobacter fumaroxidans]|nr:phage major capsid protein [Syntrophobacter fumaroxidans]
MKFERKSMKDLLEVRGRLVASMREITDNPKGEGGDLSDEQSKKFDDFKLGLASIEKQIERQTFIDEAERRMQGQQLTGNGDNRLDDELRSFSLIRAIASQVPDMADKVDCGRERELSAELQRRSGRKAQGILVPLQVFEKRVLTTALPVAGPGSNLIATDHRGDLYIDALRAALVTRRLGARVITGLIGNVDIPKLKASATSGWVAENAALTPSDQEFAKASFTPKHAGCLTEFSRNMLMQTSPDIEQLVRDDFAKVLAGAVDAVAILGGGANEPTGILETTGIGDVPVGVAGGPLTWELLVALMAECELDNVEATAFLTNAKVRKSARTILKSATDTSSNFIWPAEQPNSLAGYPAAVTSLVPSTLVKGASGAVCSALIFGDFSELLLGYWSEFDLLVNPYESTAYSKGNVQVRGMLTMDVAVRHAESFAAIQDLTTA